MDHRAVKVNSYSDIELVLNNQFKLGYTLTKKFSFYSNEILIFTKYSAEELSLILSSKGVQSDDLKF